MFKLENIQIKTRTIMIILPFIKILYFFTSSSEEGSGSENEDSGSGSDQEGSEQDTASEPGSQHTTPDNVSGEELEHGEIASRRDQNDENKTEMEEGEAISADEESKTQPESREGSYSGQDGGEKTSDKRSRQKKKHKRKNRSLVIIAITK